MAPSARAVLSRLFPGWRAVLRVALGHHAGIGLSAALGLLLISGCVSLWLGPFAASAASVGVIVVIPPDQPAPQRGKFWQLLPAALIGPPLFFTVQALHGDPWRLSLLLVPATFVAFLGAAWGKRGLPIAISIMFAMLFSMAVPGLAEGASAVSASLYFALGAAAYLVYATVANSVLNGRYRAQMLADTLLVLAQLMRTQARQMAPQDTAVAGTEPQRLIGRLLREQAALADQMQAARDIVLESPRTLRRQRLAGLLIQALELRDHLVACELDLDMLQTRPAQRPRLQALGAELETLAAQLEALADGLLFGHPLRPLGARAAAPAGSTEPDILAQGLDARVEHLHEEVARMSALARGDVAPDVALVRDAWQMFTSPTTWSWQPFFSLWRWDAPPLRHAIRAAAAVAAGQAIAVAMPWGTHDYWILLTIVVVLRGSLAQTLERRNSRVAGTLLGCLLAGALLYARLSHGLLLLVSALAQGVAHAFALRRYLVTAVAATVLALLQAHLLHVGASLAFEALERVADTLIGVALAWGFSYLLPSWERSQLPQLVRRTLAAQARHARLALGLAQAHDGGKGVELAWRLARREVYDSLSALVQATQRALSEPRAVQPPLEALGLLLAHSWQLLAQLTAAKSMLLLRRERLDPARVDAPLREAAGRIAAALAAPGVLPASGLVAEEAVAPDLDALPDPFDDDLNPWLLRRLDLAIDMAELLGRDAQQVLGT